MLVKWAPGIVHSVSFVVRFAVFGYYPILSKYIRARSLSYSTPSQWSNLGEYGQFDNLTPQTAQKTRQCTRNPRAYFMWDIFCMYRHHWDAHRHSRILSETHAHDVLIVNLQCQQWHWFKKKYFMKPLNQLYLYLWILCKFTPKI